MSDINVTVQDEIVNIDVLDTPVLVNVVNSPGQQGPAGVGVPVGGTAGQVLAKNSSTNYDTVWVNQSGGVPYSGATGNVNLGEYELKAGQVTLDTSPTGTAAVGTIRWNDTTGTSETTLKGGNVILKNGVDLVARVVNKVSPNTTLTKAAYQAVRVSGAQGQRLAVAFAQANNDANSADTIGLVTETIPTNQEGFIMTVGQLEGINTTGSLQGETWADGDVLYLSPTTAGAITNIKPTAVTGHIVVIGYVEYAHVNNGKIYVKVMNGWELGELHDVDVIGAANNDGIFLNTSTGLWEHKSISTVLGYTPEQPLTFNSPLSRAGNVVSIPQATGSVNGFLSATDWATFNSKQAGLGYTPANAATTLTINGVTYDLSTSRTWTISTGISGSGSAGQVTYWTGASAVSGSNNLFWDNANGRLGIGTNAPTYKLEVSTTSGSQTSGILIKNTGAGTSDYSSLNLLNNNNILAQVFNTSSNYTAVPVIGTNGFGHYTNGGGGITLWADGGIIKFVTGTGAGALGSQKMTLFSNGNLGINTGTTDNGQRLQVYGDTLLRGSGDTSATTALKVQNSASTNLLTIRNDGAVAIGTTLSAWSGSTTPLQISGGAFWNFGSTNIYLGLNYYFNGSSRIYIQSAAASEYRQAAGGHYWYSAISGTAGGTVSFTETMRLNIDGYLGIGTTVPTALTHLGASTTTRASLRISSGTAPTTPNDGDIWFDGTDIKMRIGGVTKTFTLI